MKMRCFKNSQILLSAFLFLVLINVTNADKIRQTRTPARILARQTGATQYEEERFENHADCNDKQHKHQLKKRASDEDVDYEVYQGVVGRPGIDFPIYPRIPKTSFSCRSFGNGYFADMETECQVFHICEDGRKISFLCPNGTIFQQSELTCDWWFKVNCLGSSGYYAESAEILNKQRLQRLRPAVPVQGFNIVGGGLNIKPKINNNNNNLNNGEQRGNRGKHNKSERRMDSNEQPSMEAVDFEDISNEKGQPPRKVITNISTNHNDDGESQITAESSSFVGGRSHNTYTYDKPKSRASDNSIKGKGEGYGENGKLSSTEHTTLSTTTTRKSYTNQSPLTTNGNNESTERLRNGQRGGQRFKEEPKTQTSSYERQTNTDKSNENLKSKLPEKLLQPIVPADNISSRRSDEGTSIKAEDDKSIETTRSTSTKLSSPTPSYSIGTYSTARRLDPTRSTPYYTPTIPPVTKGKPTEGKSHYVKGNSASGLAATTPNPNRLNVGGGNLGFFLESSAAPKTSSTPKDEALKETTTYKPYVIGLRHYHDDEANLSTEKDRLIFSTGTRFNVGPIAEKSAVNDNKKSDLRDYLPTTSKPPTTGPTYLPKSAITPQGRKDAGAESFLFAPSPGADESVQRNVDEMLKTVNLLKNKLDDTEDIKTPRTGLEIPPSSGPDALISLAKYFATEQSTASGKPNAIDSSSDKKKNEKTIASIDALSKTANTNSISSGLKPSDTTATITTEATPGISIKSDDIKSGLLSERTVNRYSMLFGLQEPHGKKAENISDGLLSQNLKSDEASKNKDTVQITPFPQLGTTDTTIRALAEKPESRKIAQVFSTALTNYLEDPKSFRQQLEAVRPTEPPQFKSATEIVPNFTPITDVDRGLFKQGTGATYLPTKPTTPTNKVPTTTTASIAAEINNKFDSTTQLPDFGSTTEIPDTTTYRPGKAYRPQSKLELSAELSPPSPDSGEGEEFLQREQTQSFVKSRNDLTANGKEAKKFSKTSTSYQTITTPKPTENPWNKQSQTDFLDPLTINDGLMKETGPTTLSPFTYLPKESTTKNSITTTTIIPKTTVGKFQEFNSAEVHDNKFGHRVGSAEVTTERISTGLHRQQSSDSWHDILSTYDIPQDILPSNNGLQRIANKLFGGLNESEALHLKNVMQQAEHNRQVLKLLLLLIQTCDDQNGKALERSRKHLLNALIDMDGKVASEKGKTAHEKKHQNANPQVPVTTTSKSTASDKQTTTTDLPSTTVAAATTTTTLPGSFEDTTKFEIHVAEPEEDQLTAATISSTNTNSSSDRRALELLKSLYSLASKFTSRR